MTGSLLYVYLGGWIVTSIGVVIAARSLQDKQEPATHPTLLSIIAGAVWPVLIIALVQTAMVAVTHQVRHDDEPLLSVCA